MKFAKYVLVVLVVCLCSNILFAQSNQGRIKELFPLGTEEQQAVLAGSRWAVNFDQLVAAGRLTRQEADWFLQNDSKAKPLQGKTVAYLALVYESNNKMSLLFEENMAFTEAPQGHQASTPTTAQGPKVIYAPKSGSRFKTVFLSLISLGGSYGLARLHPAAAVAGPMAGIAASLLFPNNNSQETNSPSSPAKRSGSSGKGRWY